MPFDIRVPIGLLFVMLGALLAVFGLFSDPAVYRASLGVNLNLVWGGAMAVFGVIMLGLSRVGR